MARSLMQAVVEVRPDLSKFKRETEREVRRSAEDAGEILAEELEDGGKQGGKAAGRQLEREMDRAAVRASRSFTDRMGDIGKGMAKAGGVMTAAVTAPMALLGRSSVEAFAQVEDARSAAGVFYGEQVGQIETFAQSAAKNFGMSQGAALDLANGMAPLVDLFAEAGEKGDVAVELMARAGDMSSFFGGTAEEAATAIKSFLSGSSVEPIRRYGVVVNQAAVENKIFELGLAATKDEITEGMKVQARYALLMETTSNAQGDFARTADSTKNSMQTAKAEMADAAAVIGESLGPLVADLSKKVAAVAEWFSELSPRTRKIILVLAGVAAIVGPLLLLFGAMAVSVSAISAALPVLAAAFAAVSLPVLAVVAAITAAIAIIWVFRDEIGDAMKWVGRQFKKLGDVLIEPFVNWRDTLQGIWDGVLNGVKALVNGYMGLWETALNGLGGTVNKTVVAAINWISPGDPVPEIPEVSLPRLATGGTVYPNGRVVHLAEGGEPEDVVPHSKRQAYAQAVAGSTTNVTMNVRVEGGRFDERTLVRELDRLARAQSATVSRPRRAR